MASFPSRGASTPRRGGYLFTIGIRRGAEKAVRSAKAGTIAYWPMQDALVIYRSYVQAYSLVNTVGKVTENLELFGSLRSGTKIRIERTQSRVLYARASVLRRSFRSCMMFPPLIKRAFTSARRVPWNQLLHLSCVLC